MGRGKVTSKSKGESHWELSKVMTRKRVLSNDVNKGMAAKEKSSEKIKKSTHEERKKLKLRTKESEHTREEEINECIAQTVENEQIFTTSVKGQDREYQSEMEDENENNSDEELSESEDEVMFNTSASAVNNNSSKYVMEFSDSDTEETMPLGRSRMNSPRVQKGEDTRDALRIEKDDIIGQAIGQAASSQSSARFTE